MILSQDFHSSSLKLREKFGLSESETISQGAAQPLLTRALGAAQWWETGVGGCPQSKVQVTVGANPGFSSGAPFFSSQQPLKYHAEPFEEERSVLAC